MIQPHALLTVDALTEYQSILRAGGTIVTATHRQAQYLKSLWGRSALAQGKTVWDTPQILAYASWLERVYRQHDERRDLLERWASLRLWQQVIAESPESALLLSLRATAEEAERTFSALLDGGLTAEQLPAHSPEEVAFKRWALTYEERTATLGVIDRAQLAGSLTASRLSPDIRVGFHGFDRVSAARRALSEAIVAAGGHASELMPRLQAGAVRRLELASPDEETDAIIDWLSEQRHVCPDGRWVVILPDLAARQQTLLRRLRERYPNGELGEIQFGRSTPLADCAVVDAAMMVLELGLEGIDLHRLGQLLRSPYLTSTPMLSQQRARLDAHLRRQGAMRLRRETLAEMLKGPQFHDPELGELLTHAHTELSSGSRLPAGDWADRMLRLLRLSSWPKGRVLSPSEYACARALTETLAKFGRLSHLLPPMPATAALNELRALVRETATPIEQVDPDVWVLDRLEDPGLPCDGLWVAGLSSERFPQPVRPNPFLALSVQRRAAVAGAFADQTLNDSRELLARWSQTTRTLVLSVARQPGEEASSASMMIQPLETIPPRTGTRAPIGQASALEVIIDPGLTPLPPGTRLERGVTPVELQQACPFHAAAAVRLKARALEQGSEGLSAQLRGEFAHLALKHLWQQLRTWSGLQALDAEGRVQAVRAAIDRAAATLKPPLPDGELGRMERRWLELSMLALLAVDATRPPFEVIACEQSERYTVAGYAIDVRIDRIDRVGDRTVLIDYKTGHNRAHRWQGPVPEPLQLPFYAAWQDATPDAIALALLPRAITGYRGLAGEAGLLPNTTARIDPSAWSDQVIQWRTTTERLVLAFASGKADVTPSRHACTYCDLSGLCRINPDDRWASADISEPEALDEEEGE